MKNPNPQGKGNLPVLSGLAAHSPRGIAAKAAPRFIADYCLSTLVLGARFGFKPVLGKDYYLYLRAGGWELSLVSPQEWGPGSDRRHVADCRLQADMTWAFELAASAQQDPAVIEALQEHVSHFFTAMAEAENVEQGLPYYVANLPYYQRLCATGLAASLRESMGLLDAPGRLAIESLAREGSGQMPALLGLR